MRRVDEINFLLLTVYRFLSYFIPFHLILFDFTLFYFIPFDFILFYLISFRFISFYFILFQFISFSHQRQYSYVLKSHPLSNKFKVNHLVMQCLLKSIERHISVQNKKKHPSVYTSFSLYLSIFLFILSPTSPSSLSPSFFLFPLPKLMSLIQF